MKTQNRKTGASFQRGNSRQDYGTPPAFIYAVEKRFGKLSVDLAAHSRNHKARSFLTNSFTRDWRKLSGLLWLNPPFDKITPWAKKCAEEGAFNGAKILLLVPASVGSNWFRDYVANVAHTVFLNGRISFDGKNPYPKDCMLCLFGFNGSQGVPGCFSIWSWNKPAK